MTSRRAFIEIKCEDTQSCSVPNCESSVDNEEGILFFSIPNNRSTEWLNAIHRKDLIGTNLASTFVCSTHFVLDDIVYENGILGLKLGVLPTQFLPKCTDESSGTPTLVNRQDDSSYNSLPPPTVPGYIYSNPVMPKIDNVFSQRPEKTIQTRNIFEKTTTPSTSQDRGFPVKTVQNLIPRIRTRLIPGIKKPLKIQKVSKPKKAKKCQNVPDKQLNKIKHTKSTQTDDSTSVHINAVLEVSTIVEKNSIAVASARSNFFSLELYFFNPKMYRLMSSHLSLSPVTELSSFVKPERSQLCKKLFAVLKSKVDTMTTIQKVCSLCVGVTRLKPHLYYNITQDNICGFEEIDDISENVKANYAYTVIAKGLCSDWSQPIAECFVNDDCNNNVSRWIIQIINELLNIGLRVQCLTLDVSEHVLVAMAPFKVTAELPFIKSDLIEQFRRVFLTFDYRKIVIKAFEAFMGRNIRFGEELASWDCIIQYRNLDSKRAMPCSPRLEEILNENGDSKIQLKYALTVFNKTLIRAMTMYRELGFLPENTKSTIKFIIMVRRLYNIFAYKQVNISKNILDVYDFLCSIDTTPYEAESNNPLLEFVACSKITVRSLLQLTELKGHKMYKYALRRLNLDCMEVFNRKLSQGVKGSDNPTAWQLRACFRKLFSRSLLKPINEKSPISPVDKFLEQCQLNYSYKLPFDPIISLNSLISTSSLVKMSDYRNIKIPKSNNVEFISGFLLSKCLEIHNDCDGFKYYLDQNCLHVNDLTSRSDDIRYRMPRHVIHLLERTPANDTDKCRSWLVVPPTPLKLFVSELEKAFTSLYGQNHSLLNNFLDMVLNISIDAPCKCFPLFYMKVLFFRLRLRLALIKTNAVLKKSEAKTRRKNRQTKCAEPINSPVVL